MGDREVLLTGAAAFAGLAALSAYAIYLTEARIAYDDEGKSYWAGQPKTYTYFLNKLSVPQNYWGTYETDDKVYRRDYNVVIIDRLERTSQNIEERNGKFFFAGKPRLEVIDTTIKKMLLRDFMLKHSYHHESNYLIHGPNTTKFDWKYGTVSTKRLWVIRFEPAMGTPSHPDGRVFEIEQWDYSRHIPKEGERAVRVPGTWAWDKTKTTQTYPPTSVNHGGWND